MKLNILQVCISAIKSSGILSVMNFND